MLRFTERLKTPEDHFKNTWLSLKGTSSVQVICVLIWMRQTLIYFNLQKGGTVNGLSNIKDTSEESLQLQKSVQSTCIFKKGGLSISYEDWAKYKKRYLMSQIQIKILKQHATPNSSLHDLKVYSSKGWRKLVKDESDVCCYSNFQSEDIYHFTLWVFASTGEYFYFWHW